VCVCVCVYLTEQDGDANETKHSGEDQASDTQPVVVCRERSQRSESPLRGSI